VLSGERLLDGIDPNSPEADAQLDAVMQEVAHRFPELKLRPGPALSSTAGPGGFDGQQGQAPVSREMLAHLPAETVAELRRTGQLAHLGIRPVADPQQLTQEARQPTPTPRRGTTRCRCHAQNLALKGEENGS
jgi:hypothetical protein